MRSRISPLKQDGEHSDGIEIRLTRSWGGSSGKRSGSAGGVTDGAARTLRINAKGSWVDAEGIVDE